MACAWKPTPVTDGTSSEVTGTAILDSFVILVNYRVTANRWVHRAERFLTGFNATVQGALTCEELRSGVVEVEAILHNLAALGGGTCDAAVRLKIQLADRFAALKAGLTLLIDEE